MKILIMCMGFEPNPVTGGGTSNVVDGTSANQVPFWNTGTEQYEPGNLDAYNTQNGSKTFAIAAGTNTYTAALTPALTAYTTGQVVTIQFTNASTLTTPTLNLNGLGAKTIVKRSSTALVSGDIAASQAYNLFYDGTNFRLLGVANTAVFNDVLATNQAASAGTRNAVNIDDTGKLQKQAWAVVDDTNRKTTKTGLDNLMVTILEEWKNSDGNSILQILNGQKVKFGGTTAFWEIDTAVTSDNAAIKINNNQAKGWKLVNHNGDEFFFVRTTTGSLGMVWRQQQEYDFGLGFKKVHAQTRIITTDTAAAWNNIASITLTANQAVSVQVNHLMAVNADGTRIAAYGNMNAIGRMDGSSVTTVSVPAFTLLGATTEAWRIAANDTADTVTIDFQNTAGTGKLFTINLDYTYIIQNI
ncbi:MAG: hypothetical protein ACXWW0_00110 [Bacteroidia bacterium]